MLVVVNEQTLTEADLDRYFTTRQVKADERARRRGPILEELIDARLVQQFLASRDTKASKEELEAVVSKIREDAKKAGADPDKVLAEKGYTAKALREEFALPIAWQHHVDRAVTPARLKEYFQEHRSEFDGTKVRARRILIKPPADGGAEGWQAAEDRMGELREQIIDGGISFADAARQHSQAPSKDQGGDVGWFQWSGNMPRQFSREAFRLKVGEISRPFRSPYGVELCEATDRKTGELALEDVRDDVLARLSHELWQETAAAMRKKARIEWKIEKPSGQSAESK